MSTSFGFRVLASTAIPLSLALAMPAAAGDVDTHFDRARGRAEAARSPTRSTGGTEVRADAASPNATAASGQTVTVAGTAAEHLSMAEHYEARAKAYREEVAFHGKMMAEYLRTHPDRKSGARNPWAVEMERHCRTIIANARPLAEEADFLARFHRARAKEFEAK